MARQMGWVVVLAGLAVAGAQGAEPLRVGFGKVDITPDVTARPVWIAGYGNNRQATSVHDPLWARAVVIDDGAAKVALVSVDLIGVQYPLTQAVRKELPGFAHVMISSTHNHEGPDVIGIWGPSERETGVDPTYLEQVQAGVVEAVRAADRAGEPAVAVYGTAEDASLVHDARLPIAKDGVLRVLRFGRPGGGAPLGVLVQWNCHPEAMESENTAITADFVNDTVRALEGELGCPVAYFTGAVGGLLTVPEDRLKGPDGQYLKGGEWALTKAYGEAVAGLAKQALEAAEPIDLTPISVAARQVLIPLENPRYRAARAIGVLSRVAYPWTGKPDEIGTPLASDVHEGELGLLTEVVYARLGELHLAGIPGEIYPELVTGKYQEPVDPGADYPEAALEPHVWGTLPGPKVLLFGLANDEVGYILPKRQWDLKPPHAYGRDKPQYGEVNSVGSEVGPILLEALKRCVDEAAEPAGAAR